MIITQISGGLGNQMFQYAAAKALSLHHNVELKLDLGYFKKEEHHELDIPRQFELAAFNNFVFTEATQGEINKYSSNNIISKKFQKLLPSHKRRIYNEKEYPFDQNFFRSKKNLYLKGHRQSEKYFLPFSRHVRNMYQLDPELYSNVEDFKQTITGCDTVAVHIRRGDYLRLPIILDWHGVLTEEYYFTALEFIKQRHPNIQILYFSDDIEWVKSCLVPRYPGIVVSETITKTHYEDFYLIQSCQHQVVANSSFSWWAAWLNPNPDKIVIAPKKWFNNAPYDTRDLIPESWLKM